MPPTGIKTHPPAHQTSSTTNILESPPPLPFGLEPSYDSPDWTTAWWGMELLLIGDSGILLSTQAISTLGLPLPDCSDSDLPLEDRTPE